MSKVDYQERKKELIEGLRDVRERILALASSLQPARQDEIYLGTWSSREVLAHLAGWDETNQKATEEILAGKLPRFYEKAGKDWAAYNAKLVSEYAREDFNELLKLARDTHTKLLDRVEEIAAQELWKDRGIRARGWKVTIGRLLEIEMRDEEEHFSQMRHFRDEGVRS